MAKRKRRVAKKQGPRARLVRQTKVGKLRELLSECDEEVLAGPIDGIIALCRSRRLDVSSTTIYAERKKMLVKTEGTQEGTLLNDLLEVKRMANRVGGLQVLKSRISTLEKLS